MLCNQKFISDKNNNAVNDLKKQIPCQLDSETSAAEDQIDEESATNSECEFSVAPELICTD